MTSGALFLGIDLGTQSVKVAAIRDGEVIASATQPYSVASPNPGWAESDPQDWRTAVDTASARVVDQVGLPSAVGLSGQMHGVVAVGSDGRALSPCIVWADGRSVEQADRITALLGSDHLSRLGSASFPGFLGATTAWWRDHDPAVLGEARWLLPAKDYLRMTLCGSVATDRSDASGTLLLDIIDRSWDTEALAVCDVTAQQLPPIWDSDGFAGVIDSGPLTGIPICVGGADTACVIHGLGLTSGEGYVGLGTGTQIVAVLDEPRIDRTLRTHTFATVSTAASFDSKQQAGWYRMAAMQLSMHEEDTEKRNV